MQPLRSSPITEPSSLVRAAPSLMLRIGTLALAVLAACSFSLGIEAEVLTFHIKAWLSFAPPTCRMPFGQYQGIPRTDPRGRVSPRF